MKKILYIIISIIFFFIFSSSLIILFNFSKIEGFFSFSLVDSLTLLLSIVGGIFLTYVISISFQQETKKKDVIKEILALIKEDFSCIMQYMYKHRNEEIDENKRIFILTLQKITDKDICILKNLCEQNQIVKNDMIESLIKKRTDFMHELTGDKLIIGNIFSDDFIEKCTELYYIIKQNIIEFKFILYNT